MRVTFKAEIKDAIEQFIPYTHVKISYTRVVRPTFISMITLILYSGLRKRFTGNLANNEDQDNAAFQQVCTVDENNLTGHEYTII